MDFAAWNHLAMVAPHSSSKKNSERTVSYQIESVDRACRIIRVLQDASKLPLFELAELAGLSRSTAFRLLATLQTNGLVVRDSDRKYQLSQQFGSGRRYRIGYLAETGNTSFYNALTQGLIKSAKRAGIDLIVMDSDSQHSPEIAIANAKKLIAEDIELAIMCQSYMEAATAISESVNHRKIPLIAIEIPHPNAIYFGVNNCLAGLTAGRHLARWAQQHWKGQVDEILLIGADRNRSLSEARLTGSLLGINEILPNSTHTKTTMIDGDWQLEASCEAVRNYLQRSKAERILVSAIFDPSALGALQAFKDTDRLHNCAIVGQNGASEALLQMRKPSSRLIGTVAYFPERFGEELIPLAMNVLTHRASIPNAVFIKHQLLTPANFKKLDPKPF
jgi:ribose transport system substrate-binding protein